MAGPKEALDGLLERVGPALGEVDDLGGAYRLLQIVVGVLAVSLAPVVVFADHIFGDPEGLRSSISAYYYGRGGNWFVGALFAMAVFFLSYEYRPRDARRRADNTLSTAASLFTVAVALAPTSSNSSKAKGSELVVHYVHGVAAVLLFVSLAIFSLYQFTKTGGDPTPRKLLRNMIYTACGWLIVAAILAALVATFVDNTGSLFFWAEVVAVTSFGISWLVKGEAFPFLNDKEIADDTSSALATS